MWKYPAIFAVFLLLAIYVARQDKRATTQGAHPGNGAVSGKTDEKHLQKDISDTAEYEPSWYGFFRWPNGTTTWAIILTLLAVAEQTAQTAKAAKATQESVGHMSEQTQLLRDSLTATQKSADAADTSARLSVGVAFPALRIVDFDFGADMRVLTDIQWPKTKIVVRNYGQTPAFLHSWSLNFSYDSSVNSRVYRDGAVLEGSVVEAQQSFTLDWKAIWPRPELLEDEAKAVVERDGSFVVYGYVQYGNIFDSSSKRLAFSELLLNIFPDGSANWMPFQDNQQGQTPS